MRVWIFVWGVLLTFASAEATTTKVGAADLLASSEQAYRAALAAARQNGSRLDPADPRHAPFWNTLVRMGQSLQVVRATLESSDPQVFQALRTGSRTLAELRVNWSRLGIAAPAVEAQIAALASSYRLLRSGYGREGLRERQSPSLAEEEQRWLARWQDSQRRFADQLRILVAQATERGDQETVAELQPILEDAERIGQGDPILDTYLEASLASDTVEGEWEALSDDLAEAYPDEWQAADAIMDQISVESEFGFVMAANLGEVAAYLDEEGEIVEGTFEKEGEGEELEVVEEEAVDEEARAEEEVPYAPPSPDPADAAPTWKGLGSPKLPKSGFHLFAGRDERERFQLFSRNQRAAPAAYWLALAASTDRRSR